MSMFIPSSGIEKTRSLARSALPDAPVVPDEPPRLRRKLEIRTRAGAMLRATARHELKLADRIDPVPQPS